MSEIKRKPMLKDVENPGPFIWMKGDVAKDPKITDHVSKDGKEFHIMSFPIMARDDKNSDGPTYVTIRYTGELKSEIKKGSLIDLGGYVNISPEGRKRITALSAKLNIWPEGLESKKDVKPERVDVFDKDQRFTDKDYIKADQSIIKIEGRIGNEEFIWSNPVKDKVTGDITGYMTNLSVAKKLPLEEYKARKDAGLKPIYIPLSIYSDRELKPELKQGMSIEVEGALVLNKVVPKNKEDDIKVFAGIAVHNMEEVVYPPREQVVNNDIFEPKTYNYGTEAKTSDPASPEVGPARATPSFAETENDTFGDGGGVDQDYDMVDIPF